MFAFILLLTTCIGTWVVLRRHPLYTGHAALRIVGGTLLLIAASAGVILLAVWLTADRSTATLLAVILGAVVLATFGMAYGFTVIATPQNGRLNTRLPPTATPVNLHRRALRRWWLPALVFFGFCGLAALIPGPTGGIVVGLGLVAAVPAAIVIPVRYITARRLDRAVTALQLNPWLHWHYSPEARAAWIDVYKERLRSAPSPKLDLRMLWLCAAIIFAGVMLIAGDPWLIRAASALGLCALVIGVVKITDVLVRPDPDRTERRMRAAPPDVYFGHDGVLCDDRFLTWLDTNQYLVSAILDERTPRSVALEFKKIMAGGYTGPHTVTIRQPVLIPATDNETDLQRLQSELKSRCPSAHVQLA